MHIRQGAIIMDIGAHAIWQLATLNGRRGISRIKRHRNINLTITKQLS